MEAATELQHLREFSAQETSRAESLRKQVEDLIQEVSALRVENAALKARLPAPEVAE